MPAAVASRAAESLALAEFLRATATGPSALIIEGEPGIGKTTLWLTGVEQARTTGFRVLAARPVAAESVLAYASLADMLGDLDTPALSDLPPPQRVALDRVLLRADDAGATTDQRAVGAAFLSVVTALADQSPVLLAIDDLQWLDSASRNAVAFTARRLSGRVGVLATVRTDADGGSAASWLVVPRPGNTNRTRLCPLGLGDLHAVLSSRLGRSFTRPAITQIHDVSGGNPFYALELARAMEGERTQVETSLPDTLSELVRDRLGGLDDDVADALLVAACAAAPTVALVAGVIGADTECIVERLEDAESKGIIGIHGDRLRFTHPLLATGVYAEASGARRRSVHRRLAAIVEEPELRARHLALAATHCDPQTLRALESAAEMARMRGAPSAAAELLELAIALGDDTAERRIRLAGYHFNAGDPGRARALLEETIARLTPGALRARAMCLLANVQLSVDSFNEAADLLRRALDETGADNALKAEILLPLGFALMNLGQLPAAIDAVRDAVMNAERIADSALLSQALGSLVALRMVAGDGLDDDSLRRSMELEDRDAPVPVTYRPSMMHALCSAWAGRLQQAHDELRDVRRRCIERGEENEQVFVSFHSVLIGSYRGDFIEAGLIADDSMERALQLGGDLPLTVALTNRCIASAYVGRVAEARSDADGAIAAAERCGSYRLAEWPMWILGFIDVSLGDYGAALTSLEPLVARIAPAPQATEIFVAWFIPDAVEAMVHLERFDEADRLIGLLESNGARLDRAWMLATGGRCRAMLLAAQGDVAAANVVAQQAMTDHARLPMPFERARTQLLLGQLQRRRRQKGVAASTLREALEAFEKMGAELWAARARAELARTKVPGSRGTVLTPSERRVAEMAASGMKNRDVAAALFISPKTVEVNLARIYRKLGIHSRAELGRHMTQPERNG
jgi:ATP/maltotriose-dependent transcriptional regulator MalT